MRPYGKEWDADARMGWGRGMGGAMNRAPTDISKGQAQGLPLHAMLSLLFVFGLDCDAFAAFGAAAGQDFAARFGLHASSEAMDLVASALFRLVRSFGCHVVTRD